MDWTFQYSNFTGHGVTAAARHTAHPIEKYIAARGAKSAFAVRGPGHPWWAARHTVTPTDGAAPHGKCKSALFPISHSLVVIAFRADTDAEDAKTHNLTRFFSLSLSLLKFCFSFVLSFIDTKTRGLF